MARSVASEVLMLAATAMLLLLVTAPRAADALTCGQVVSFLRPCIPYVTGKTTQLSACCAGVQGLNAAAKTTPDRQTACSCMKSNVGNIKELKPDLAGGIPGKCGVSVPYPISTSVDCSKVN